MLRKAGGRISAANQTKTVLITGARAPVARDLALSFRRAGWRTVLADSLFSFAAALSHDTFERYASPRFAFAQFKKDIGDLVRRYSPALIIPTCEEVYWLAAAAEGAAWQKALFAPPLDILRVLHSKVEFARVAAEAGLSSPKTWRVSERDDLQAFAGQSTQLVFKPEFSRFACQVAVRPKSLTGIVPSVQTPWTVQEFVEGDEYCLWCAAIKGELVAFAAYRPKWRKGHSAGFYFEADNNEALVDVARRIAKHLGTTGQLSFDVIRRPDGTVVPIECNPRATSGIHLYDASPALADALSGVIPYAAPIAATRYLGPAMWLIGAPQALARGAWREFQQDLASSHDVLERGWFGMLLDIAQFVLGGLLHRQSTSAYTTRDMEWNGGPIP